MFDLAIIGGGINGCGIARDAASRGLSVVLLEQGDIAGATSSVSTKLIHGGLRYLEQYEFGLVRAALAEREMLWRMAPHLIRPLRFILAHQRGLRPRWMLRAGLFLYDHLARRALLPAAMAISLLSRRRYWSMPPCLYGTRAHSVLALAKVDGPGRHFGADLRECEARYLIDN